MESPDLIRPLYRDFLRFLRAMEEGEEAWPAYRKFYLEPHRKVVLAHWAQVHGLPLEALKERVEKVRPQHYGLLRFFDQMADLSGLAHEGLKRSSRLLPLSRLPQVYLLVGFFSPDGTVIKVDGEWAIAIGMERLRRASDVALLVAHEYGHVARKILGPEEPQTLLSCIVAEGLSTVLVRKAFPDAMFPRHLFLDRRRWNALILCESEAWEEFQKHLHSEDKSLIRSFIWGGGPDGKFPPRMGIYLGYRLVDEIRGSLPLSELFSLPSERFLEFRREKMR